ncbi:MAG: glucokinase [Oceanospirillaceae bacterium]|nr:glucokinase [Oceanospirillaceae bacterium]
MSYYALVGDIGGTNARFALVEEASVELAHVEVLNCQDFNNFDQAVAYYYQKIGVNPLNKACISFACPIGDDLKMTNNHWAFNVKAMQKQLGLEQFLLLNDFTAMAYGMLFIESDEKVVIQSGSAKHAQHPRLVLGPGTGLGVSSLVPQSAHAQHSVAELNWQAVATEGGHISFAPTNELQLQILAILQRKYQRVSVERILSGDGIVALYLALCQIKQCPQILDSAAQITTAAMTGEDPIALQTLETFCDILGAVTGDLVLAQGARGGVYLCGGIPPRIREFLLQSNFRIAMADKGRFKQYLSQVPVWLCDAKYPGLLGAAAALKIQG